MARRKAPYTQSEVTKALKAVRAAGWTQEQIAGVKFTKDGFVLLLGEPQPVQSAGPKNEWDEVLQ